MKLAGTQNSTISNIEDGEAGIIKSPGDLARLNIVDWDRYKEYWKSPSHAVDVLGVAYIGFRYNIVSVNLCGYPERDDFPDWEHIGMRHKAVGHLFWNFFQHEFSSGELNFHDQPDLSGYVFNSKYTPAKREFWGDIGKVAPITLLDMRSALFFPCFWISAINEFTIVTLEAPPRVK